VILLVEDEEAVRHLTRELLELLGYRVIEAANGREALSICERAAEPIHLVLTDVIMPMMTGTQLVARLKELRPDIGVMYMSGYTGDTLLEQGVSDNDIAFLQKPFSTEALARKVKQAISRQSGR
jgi:two-component system, cell cycle sensor histidine kinase and response regulator CckA